MAIRIPSKADKQLIALKDALRILAWQTYKAENDVNGLDGYAQFQEEWLLNDIHKKKLTEVLELIKTLGYSEAELQELRRSYYARRERGGYTEESPLPVAIPF